MEGRVGGLQLLSIRLFQDTHQRKRQPGLLTSIPFVVSKGGSSKHGKAWGGGLLPYLHSNPVSWVPMSSSEHHSGEKAWEAGDLVWRPQHCSFAVQTGASLS